MADARLLHVCVSTTKGVAKHAVASAQAVVDHGLEGDAHAGDGHRQISLLAHTDIEGMRAKGLVLEPGAFGENLVVAGLDTAALGVGTRLAVGPVELVVSQVGKVCHTRCAIYDTAGDCIMPRAGLFARVATGGALRPGVAVTVLDVVPRDRLQAAVVTVSDSCSAGTALDTAGPAVAEALRGTLDAHVAWTRLVPDERTAIEGALRELCDRRVDLVVTVGGTGCAPRDVTPEATRSVIEREVPGLAEKMRRESAEVAPHAWLSRAVAGIHRETLIVNLPGSRKGAVENLAAIAPLLPHVVVLLRGATAHAEHDPERLRFASGLAATTAAPTPSESPTAGPRTGPKVCP